MRNQDDEHNLRIVRAGGRLWQSSRIRSSYRPRATLGQVFRQYLQYGYWKPFVMKKHGQAASLRHFVPAAFVVANRADILGPKTQLGARHQSARCGTHCLKPPAHALAVASAPD